MTDSFFEGLAPLATRMRPRTIEEVVGQQQILRAGSPLRKLAEPSSADRTSSTTSVILWGPPGTGKTTLARAVAFSSGRRIVELSAITAGVKDVRDAMEAARLNHEAYGVGTILFLDEIHRFSKAQQDALLPGVENGWVTLIAATTENPSFSVISPLLSRSLLLTLDSLAEDELVELLHRAVADPRGLAAKFVLSDELAKKVAQLASGDARRALTILDAAAQVVEDPKGSAPFEITEAAVEAAINRALVRYDKDGDQHYDIISAFIKSVRGSDADAAVHYLARMIEGGEDPRFIARRLMILAAEDIGLADPQALPLAVAAAESVAMIGMPEGRIPLAEVSIYLALAPKSNSAYLAINAALEDVRGGASGPVPKHLRSSSYPGAAKLGNGEGYQYPHDDSRAVLAQQYLAGDLSLAEYYQPKEIGAEREFAERWPKLRAIIRSFKR
ncbi:MAG: replication-associated recombination protein A [Micrococcales bacterium]